METDKVAFKNILMTGCCGFIGSNVINYLTIEHPTINFVNLDCLTYCGYLENVSVCDNDNYHFVEGSICDMELLKKIFREHSIDAVVHFAAETHVDNSFENSVHFVNTNIIGTINLLECSREFGVKKFIHVSTDEVYGEIMFNSDKSTTDMKLDPTNPYSASKAGAEYFVNVFSKCYGIPAIITRGNNVFGPRQYPEKIIPKFIKALLNNEKCTIHGNGQNTRNYIHTEDVAKAFEMMLFRGECGQVYNIGSSHEYSVIEILKKLVKLIKNTDNYEEWMRYVQDRPFNDLRYAIDTDNLEKLGWSYNEDFDKCLVDTIEWYKHNNYFK